MYNGPEKELEHDTNGTSQQATIRFLLTPRYHSNACKKGSAAGVIELKTSCNNSVQ